MLVSDACLASLLGEIVVRLQQRCRRVLCAPLAATRAGRQWQQLLTGPHLFLRLQVRLAIDTINQDPPAACGAEVVEAVEAAVRCAYAGSLQLTFFVVAAGVLRRLVLP